MPGFVPGIFLSAVRVVRWRDGWWVESGRCESGGIGRRTGFRFQRVTPSGFESRLSHHGPDSRRSTGSAGRRPLPNPPACLAAQRITLAAKPLIGQTTPFRRPGQPAGVQTTSTSSRGRAVVAGAGMQVQVESVGNLERRMTLHLPTERLETQVGGRLRRVVQPLERLARHRPTTGDCCIPGTPGYVPAPRHQ